MSENKVTKQETEDWLWFIKGIYLYMMKMYGGVTGIRDEGGVYNSVLKFLIYSKRHISNPYNVAAFVYAEFATRHHFMTAINEWLT